MYLRILPNYSIIHRLERENVPLFLISYGNNLSVKALL